MLEEKKQICSALLLLLAAWDVQSNPSGSRGCSQELGVWSRNAVLGQQHISLGAQTAQQQLLLVFQGAFFSQVQGGFRNQSEI